MGKHKPSGIKAGRKLRNKRRLNLWADKNYKLFSWNSKNEKAEMIVDNQNENSDMKMDEKVSEEIVFDSTATKINASNDTDLNVEAGAPAKKVAKKAAAKAE